MCEVEQPVVLPRLVRKTKTQQGSVAAPPLYPSSRPQSDVFAHGFSRGSGSRVSNAPIPMNTSAGELFPPSNASDNTDYPRLEGIVVVLACSLFPRLPFPLSHVRQEETLSD